MCMCSDTQNACTYVIFQTFNTSTSVMGKVITRVYVGASSNGNKPMENFFIGCVKVSLFCDT